MANSIDARLTQLEERASKAETELRKLEERASKAETELRKLKGTVTAHAVALKPKDK